MSSARFDRARASVMSEILYADGVAQPDNSMASTTVAQPCLETMHCLPRLSVLHSSAVRADKGRVYSVTKHLVRRSPAHVSGELDDLARILDLVTASSHSRERKMVKIIFEVVPHDGAWAYRVDGVYSETFPTHDAAR